MSTGSPNPAGCYAAAVVLIAATGTAVALRFNVRRMKKLPLGLDDLFILISLVLTWGFAAVYIWGTARGTIGTHTILDPKTGLIQVTWHESDIARLAYITQIISIVAYGTIKLSALFLFRRIFVGPIFNIASLVTIAIVIAWTTSFFFATIFECGGDPVMLWTSPKTVAQFCSTYKNIQLGHAVSDVLTDLIVLTIPLPIILKLHMSLSQKLGLVFVFLLGYLSTAAALARVVLVVQDLFNTTTGARDLRAEETNVITWALVEAGVGVIATSLPTMRPYLSMRMPESVINSVRSKLSLQSLGSGSKRSHNASDSEFSKKGKGSYAFEENLTHDRGGQIGDAVPAKDEIVRGDEFRLSEDRV